MLSEKLPLAEKGRRVSGSIATNSFVGLSVMDCRLAALILSEAKPEISPEKARMLTVPVPVSAACTRPFLPSLLSIDAMLLFLDSQLTNSLICLLLPSV